jgi:hypothetical protein
MGRCSRSIRGRKAPGAVLAAVLAAAFACAREPAPLHVLTLAADGALGCEDGALASTAGRDDETLRRHLAEVRRAAPSRPMFEDQPQGPRIPDGRLEVEFAGEAECAAFLRLTETCLRSGIGFWDLRLVATSGARAGGTFPFRLSMDGGANVGPPVEDLPIELRAHRGIQEGPGDASALEFVIARPFRRAEDGAGELSFESLLAGSRSELAARLSALRGAWPARALEIRVPGDLSLDAALDLVDLAAGAGWTRVHFAGGWFGR